MKFDSIHNLSFGQGKVKVKTTFGFLYVGRRVVVEYLTLLNSIM